MVPEVCKCKNFENLSPSARRIFSTLLLLAAPAGKKLAPSALKQFSGGRSVAGARVPRKISNTRYRDRILSPLNTSM
jgi:hypothetical protein